ncbi:CYFA0S20e00386g1_1 [Cyberlindnera fabianii]|nr:CYFA0S20e00386g1_1 [Cyberlindnera fabianii]
MVKNTDRMSDKDYDIEERRYKTLSKAGKDLEKESKGYLDSLRAMTQAQVRIAEVISSLYDDSKSMGGSATVGNYYLQCVQEFDQETVKQLDGPFRETVLTPITTFCQYFNEIDEAIKKRAHKKIDYEGAKAKVRRLVDKPAKDASKLPRAEKELQLAKEVYDQLNEQLKEELPQLISLRVPYFDPSFEALVKIQLRFCTEGYTRLAQIQNYLNQEDRDAYSQGLLDDRISQLLMEMSQLQIASLGVK